MAEEVPSQAVQPDGETQHSEPPNRPSTPPHLSHDPARNAKSVDPFQFGQRYLNEADDPFAFNAWDHVQPDEEHEKYCEVQYAMQRASPVSDFDRKRFNDNPEKWWNLFYKQKQNTFFKDRKWLRQEFPVLGEITQRGAGKKRVLEVGAGAGNTAFPILRNNDNEELIVFAYDFSKTAVKTIREDEGYDEKYIRAEVWDVASEENGGLPPGIEPESLDVVVMIFIFSALSPSQWEKAVKNIFQVLKPGGQVLFRDYGRGDLAQVRFKAGRWMGENFYVRGDGTRVYFFDIDELKRIWRQEVPRDSGTSSDTKEDAEMGVAHGGFEIANLDVDRRMIVNRQRRIKMYRCWIQGRFMKPLSSGLVDSTASPAKG
ncbi:putative actin binding [Phaeomoniella chlamydospora]|uniref:tRNA N(3)-methylcytidine methyltransferase n=1 Tax=Phaeomoniella chlamydospora TaxID=158046 RepID=A0A0G2E6P1_PHACM|nr:putative actin binding [Phaeomoniella chlamydospora]